MSLINLLFFPIIKKFRVAEVWMDEYAEYLYKRRPALRIVNPGGDLRS